MKHKEGNELRKANPGSSIPNPFAPDNSKTQKGTWRLHPPIIPCPNAPDELATLAV